jgi:hypothetical protein
MMSAVELAAWQVMIGGEIPPACPARFEAAAIIREIIAEGHGGARPRIAPADPVPMPAPAAKRQAG